MKQRIAFLLLILLLPVVTQAMEWQHLEQMRQAIQEQNYRGEFMHRRGDQTSVYSVIHQHVDGKSTELLRQLDGDMIEVVRRDDKLICYFPPGTEDAAKHAIPAAPFSQVSQLDLKQIASNYQARSLGQARVAGLKTYIIELSSDEWRFRQKLWLEAETKILLQSEILDNRGQVLEQFRFTRIELGADITASELDSLLADQEGIMQQVMARTPQVKSKAVSLHTTVGWVPAGFDLVFSEQQMTSDGWIDKRSYSDGLASYSIFAEAESVADKPDQSAAMAKMGATAVWMTHHNGLSVTVVGEIPGDTARQIANNLKIEDF